ncbi:hypothetical protein EUGRSUZ_A02744 [Eucalyptus grandis]|uniref:Uncharacterized protein n=2 Tax=Eucalyptus grandis TaxID=71139 RepID=A0ACC3M8R0_EUCGR|nr:hypothetical protein EUGRSUZ_A02744 [Eucalyptus grandis]
MLPTKQKACSGRPSNSPERISLNPLIVSTRPTYFPGESINTSATKKGWDKKRSIFRALATVKRSSSDNSSNPRIAIMSLSSL